MSYKKPKMILFDVGGTLFNDGKCNAADGFKALLQRAENPDVTTAEKLASHWDEFLAETEGFKSKSGVALDVPLSAVIKYATMKEGLKINLPVIEQEEIFDQFNSTRTVIDGVPELLEALKNLNIRTAVISNNMMRGESLALALKHWIPSSNFEFILTSADILFCKPCKDIFECAVNFGKDFNRYSIAIVEAGAEEEAKELRVKLEKMLPNAEIKLYGNLTPALVVHTGPGLIGIGVQKLG